MIRIRGRSGMSEAIPWILRIKFGCATFGRLIEHYYAPTAVDVVLILLEGEAELAGDLLTSKYEPNDDHYKNWDNHGS